MLTKCSMWLFMVFEYKWHLENVHVLSYWSPHAKKNWLLLAIKYVKYCCYSLSEVLRRDVLPTRKFSAARLPQLKTQSQVPIPCHLTECSIYRKKMFVGCWVKVWNDECISTWGTFSSTMTYKYAFVISKYRHLISVQSNSASPPHNI